MVKLTGTEAPLAAGEAEVVGEAAVDAEAVADAPGAVEAVLPPPPPPLVLPEALGEADFEGEAEAVAETHLLFSHLFEAQSEGSSQALPTAAAPPAHLPLVQVLD